MLVNDIRKRRSTGTKKKTTVSSTAGDMNSKGPDMRRNVSRRVVLV
jgi:hypothetical protein